MAIDFTGTKAEKLQDEIMALPGVESVEAYLKPPEVLKALGVKISYDILVRTENGHMIEGRLSGTEDLERFYAYLTAVLDLQSSNLRNYPQVFRSDKTILGLEEADALSKIR